MSAAAWELAERLKFSSSINHDEKMIDEWLAEQTAALRAENERFRHFVDFTVREWLAYDEHQQCAPSCTHRRALTDKYERLDALLAAPEAAP